MKTDTELLDWLNSMKHLGLAVISDDNGHYAVSGDGYQNCAPGKEPIDIQTTFFVPAGAWRDNVRQAIQDAIDEDEGDAEATANPEEPK